jgi:hypothetical protein
LNKTKYFAYATIQNLIRIDLKVILSEITNMRKLFLWTAFFFLTLSISYSQNTDSLAKDSLGTTHIQTKDGYQDSINQANMERNLNAFVTIQKERERKQKQQMYIRIALGVFFLIVLIVGITRRKKQKNKTP